MGDGIKKYKLPVTKYISLRDVVYSMVTIGLILYCMLKVVKKVNSNVPITRKHIIIYGDRY